MSHLICRIREFEIVAPYTLRVLFDDATEQIIDFEPVLHGELSGPLRDPALFNRVALDTDVATLVWPNGADFDPRHAARVAELQGGLCRDGVAVGDRARLIRVALVGDYNAQAIAHRAIPEALRLCGETESVWTHTASITNARSQFANFDGIWCVPASPYENTEGALEAIRFARESGLPFLGTCGGFQYAAIEYARNIFDLTDADHAELSPSSSFQLISPLACSLVEKTGEIFLSAGGLLRKAYGSAQITEGYHCSYGLNPDYASLLFRNGLHATAHDAAGEVRAMELSSHPFYVATLFQPERRALQGEIPPLVAAFVAAMRRAHSCVPRRDSLDAC